MNNIYKVIWSKAKNCYVVASEIAKSHTKSASGSEKMGGDGKRALLALAAASAIFCGGLVNVGASVQSETISPTGTTSNPVLTVDNTDDAAQLNKVISAAKEDKLVTKDNISGQLTDYAKASDLSAKADANTVNDISTRVGTLETTVGNDTGGLVKDVNEAKTDITNIKNTIGDASNGLVKNVATLETKVGDASSGLVKDVAALETKVGDASSGLVKDVAALETKVGDASSGLVKDVTTLKTTVGDASCGLVKDVADLNAKTTRIGYDAANDTTSINGIQVGQQVDMGGKKLTNVGTINGIDLGTVDTQAKTNADNIQTNANNIKNNKDEIARVNGELVKTNNYFNSELSKTNDYFNAELSKTNRHFNTELGKTNAALQATNKRTAGIDRIDATSETTIEKNVKVDNRGNVTAKGNVTADGKLKGEGVDAGTGAITTTGAVNAGSLIVTDASHLKGDVTMDNKLSVTGDTSLKKTDVDGALNAKGDVILGTNAANTVTVNGKSDFKAAVEMENGLTVTNGETKLKKTTVEGDLKVTGTITTDKMVFGDKATNNYTEIDHGKVTSKNLVVNGAGETISSSSTFNAKKNEVGFANSITGEQSSHKQTSDVIKDTVKNNITGDQSFHKQTSDVIMDNVKDGKNSNNRTQTKTETKDIITDENGNSSTTSQTASENKTYLKDKDGKNTNSTIDTAKGYDKTIKGENGETSTKQDELNITNTAKAGTITNTAKNVTNEGTESVTNTVGGNEVKVSKDGVNIKAEAGKKITESVGTASRVVENDKITDKAADSTVTTEKGKGTTFGKEGSTGTTNIYGDSIRTGTINAKDTTTDKLTAGAAAGADGGRLTVDANDGVKGSYKSGKYTSRSYILANTLKSGVDNDKDPTDTDFVGSRTDHYMDGDKAKLDETVKDADGSNVTNKTSTGTATTITDGNGKTSATIQDVKNLAGSVTNGTETGVSGIHANDDGSVSIDSAVAGGSSISTINQKKDSITSQVTDGTTITKTEQGAKDITNTATAGTITNDAKDIVNKAQNTITNTAGTSITNQVKDSKVTTDVDGTTFENKTAAVSDGGTTTTKINGNHINTGRVDANELDVSDKDEHGNTADLSVEAGKGVKASAGNGTTTGSLDVKADGITTSITHGTDHNTVNSTLAGGTIFSNSGAAAPVTGASGAGTHLNTTIKGNTITTGKVTMDYADVMKDLGVYGNANIAGTTTTKTLNVTENATVGGTLDVRKKATFHNDVRIDQNLSVGEAVTAKSYKVGDKTYIDANGINANNQKITNVADGSISEGSKDAVNGGQLYGVKRDLEHQVDKVGANAAAMANLRPMEFDPSSKWNIAAAIGNYGSETAAALGAFYRPNDDVMVNLSTAFGTGENMVGGGVSVRLGKGGNKLSREENNALKAQVDDLTTRMDALLSVLNPNMSKDFPDVPENHWAYEAVSRLAGNDIVQGYPDGEFHGERTMTRYEMAEIIYNALSRGAEAERELVEEFKPELQAMAASEKATAEKAEG